MCKFLKKNKFVRINMNDSKLNNALCVISSVDDLFVDVYVIDIGLKLKLKHDEVKEV